MDVLAMLGVSLGGITSNLAAGYLLEHYGPDAPYKVAGVGAMLLGVLVPVLLPSPTRPQPDDATRSTPSASSSSAGGI